MINRLNILRRFIRFYFKAKTKYNVHSPFVFEFVNNILEDDRSFYVFKEAEILRQKLMDSTETVEVTDFGAGSHVDSNKKIRKISSIASSALSPAFQCEWLFRICHLYKPLTVIELGTSLGVSTLYICEGAPQNARIYTLEGSSAIAALAQRHFNWFYDVFAKHSLRFHSPDVVEKLNNQINLLKDSNLHKINIIEGNFDTTFKTALTAAKKLDLCFIDGNHRYEPTLAYFEQCLPYIHEHSILIFDDIHWSDDMEKAWEHIKQHPSVRLTIDLFWCGIVFFRHENHEKEHFSLIKASWKPFSIM